MAEFFWQISRKRMLVFNIEELRPSGHSPLEYNEVRLSSLAADCNQNRHEFALMHSPKRHSKTAFSDSNIDLYCSSLHLYHCKVEGLAQNEIAFVNQLSETNPELLLSLTEFKLSVLIKDNLTGVGLDIRQELRL